MRSRQAIVAVLVVVSLHVETCPAANGQVEKPLEISHQQVRTLVSSISGRTLIVDWHGTWDYTTVQAALDASQDGDTIIVLPSAGSPAGAYVENIIFPARAVTLRSINPQDPAIVAATVLDGNKSGPVVSFYQVNSTSARLDGFTIRNGYAGYYGGGVYCSYSSATITISNCTITGNRADYAGGGIAWEGSSPTMITNCTISGNNGGPEGGGIYLEGGSAIISNCTIKGNSAWYCGGIDCNGAACTVVNCTISGNHGGGIGGGIFGPSSVVNTIVAFNSSGVEAGAATILRHNCVYGNGAYNYTGLNDPTGINGNLSADPRFASPSYGNVHIQPNSPCLNAGDDQVVQGGWVDIDGQTRIQNGHVDIGADESDGVSHSSGPYAVVRVSPNGDDNHDGSSWMLAKRTVQAGIDAAVAAGGQVWIRAGTFLERITLPPYVHVYGGFAGTEAQLGQRTWSQHESILDGQGSGGPSIVTISSGHLVSTLDGVTVHNGLSGGVSCESSSPNIANCTITDNSGFYAGGIGLWSSSAVIVNCVVMRNRSDQYGGGILCANYSSPIIANCVIAKNRAASGGGVSCYYSSAVITNCTIVGNRVSGSGGGVDSWYAVPTIANTLMAFNSSGIHNSTPGYFPFCEHNCVFGNREYNYILGGLSDPTGTNGNISADPLFRSANPGTDGIWATSDDVFTNLRLRPGSPCIDAGNNADVPADLLDLDGDANISEPLPFDLAGFARCFDDPTTVDTGAGTSPIVDIGAYEFSPVAPADFDADGDVDTDDLNAFRACATSPGIPYNPATLPQPAPSCTLTPDANGKITADFDSDGDVDQDDFGVLQRCYSGAGKPSWQCQ